MRDVSEELAPRLKAAATKWRRSRRRSTGTFVTDRSVDTLVKRLRRKIEGNAANPVIILTVWGAGYKAADV